MGTLPGIERRGMGRGASSAAFPRRAWERASFEGCRPRLPSGAPFGRVIGLALLAVIGLACARRHWAYWRSPSKGSRALAVIGLTAFAVKGLACVRRHWARVRSPSLGSLAFAGSSHPNTHTPKQSGVTGLTGVRRQGLTPLVVMITQTPIHTPLPRPVARLSVSSPKSATPVRIVSRNHASPCPASFPMPVRAVPSFCLPSSSPE